MAPNLLASGADDGEICIWDLANPTEPTHFPPLRVGIDWLMSVYLKFNSFSLNASYFTSQKVSDFSLVYTCTFIFRGNIYGYVCTKCVVL